MLILQISIYFFLLIIFFQDLRSRSVSWPCFPLLAVCGGTLQSFLGIGKEEILITVAINLFFLIIQFLFIALYFSLRKRRYTPVMDHMIGWGDALFLTSIAFFLPPLTYIFFYVTSLFLVLAGWLCYRYFSRRKDQHIPLAGLQALLMLFFISGDWLFGMYNVYNENIFNFFKY